MRALTLTQPWATLVAYGEKRIEMRSWKTEYRGPLAIHAAKGMAVSDRRLCVEEPFASALRRAGYGGLALLDPANGLPHSTILAVATLTNVWPTEMMDPQALSIAISENERAFGDYSPGRYAWILEDIRRLHEPVAAKGHLGLWRVLPEQAILIDCDLIVNEL